MPPSKENFLERKITCLEKRLTLVERFVELRFSESLKDFSIRKDDDDDDDTRPGPGRKKLTEKNIKSKTTPDPSSLAVKIPGRRGRPPKASKISAVAVKEASTTQNDTDVDTSPPRKVRKSYVVDRPAPASVKRRKAQAEADLEESSKKEAENMKNCVVRVVKCSAAEEAKKSRTTTSSTTPTGSRARRTAFGREEIIEDYTRKPRYKTRRKRRGDDDEEDEGSSVVHENDEELILPDCAESPEAVDDHHDGVPSAQEDNNNGEEDEEGESYFSFPTNSPGRKRNVNDQREDDDEMGLGAVDPSDGNWSGAEDGHSYEDGEEEYVEPDSKPKHKKANVCRKSVATGAKRGRKPLEDSESPRKRTYISAKFEALPTDAIAGNDPTKKECPICHKHFKNEMIVNHMEGHMKERHLKCPECDKTYFNQAMLRKHMRVHQPEKYGKKCRLCEKVFYQSDKVLAHERFCVKKALEKNESVDPNIVEDLKKRSSAGWLEESLLLPKVDVDILSADAERKQCPHCKRSFRADIYDRHVKTHETTRNWACNLCEKAYFHKHDLVRHVATEHVQNPSCDLCQKSFKDRASLKLHLTACRREQRKSIKIKNVTSLQGSHEETEVGVKYEMEDTNSRGTEIGMTTIEIPLESSQRTEENMEETCTELMESTERIQDNTEENLPSTSREVVTITSASPQQASLVLVNPHTGVEEQTVTFVIQEIAAEEEIISS